MKYNQNSITKETKEFIEKNDRVFPKIKVKWVIISFVLFLIFIGYCIYTVGGSKLQIFLGTTLILVLTILVLSVMFSISYALWEIFKLKNNYYESSKVNEVKKIIRINFIIGSISLIFFIISYKIIPLIK